jgi:hypothetical protein
VRFARVSVGSARVRARRGGPAAVRPLDFVAGWQDSIQPVVLPVKPFSREHGVSAGRKAIANYDYFFTNRASEAV